MHVLGFKYQRYPVLLRIGGEAASAPPPSYTPSLDFSDARNSMYLGVNLCL